MVACTASLNSLASNYTGLGAYIGLATAAPGSGTTVSNEATGGSPAYARKLSTWSAGATGVQNGTAVTIDVPAGTYTHAALCSAATGATMVDNVALSPSIVMGAQGQIVVTPQITIT